MALGNVHWTYHEHQKLRQLFADGLSFGQMAKRMGNRSRCAIAGKVHRMKRDGML